jgi:predicted HicB family RNase H-like nuclease
MPPTLHETLTKLAEFEGVSFNQYMVSSLAIIRNSTVPPPYRYEPILK